MTSFIADVEVGISMINKSDLKVGLRIMYVPAHARAECGYNENDYIEHKDAELGFVTSWNEWFVFCRFYVKGHYKLRTVANSEACDISDLFISDYISQEYVNKTISLLKLFPERFGWVEQNDKH